VLDVVPPSGAADAAKNSSDTRRTLGLLCFNLSVAAAAAMALEAARAAAVRLPSVGARKVAEHKLAVLAKGAKTSQRYAPQSATIQGILTDMYSSFTETLETRTTQEHSAQRAYEDLMATYQSSLLTMQESLATKESLKAESETMLAEPTLLNAVGRPRPGCHQPSMSMANWHQRKTLNLGHEHPSGWPARDHDTSGLNRSQSMPGSMFGQQIQEPPSMFSWQMEDHSEKTQIEKPGGYVVQLKDSVEIQSLKNRQRNKGTYKLFGGSFEGTTTQAAVHNLRALGMERY